MSMGNDAKQAGAADTLSRPVLVVAHDAGGAEVVAGWLKKHACDGFGCVVEGPSARVFTTERFPSMRTLSRNVALAELARFGSVLTGSSWASDLERVFIGSGRKLGIRTVTYLDHWTDYRQRFATDDGRLVLPHEIWVGDGYAERIAGAEFPGQPIRVVENAYLDETAERIRAASAMPRSSRKRALFVSEPLAAAAERKYGDPNYFGYTETQALEAFLAYAAARWAREVESVRIRRHPSEAPGKFAAFLAGPMPFPVSECGDAPLIDDCAWADRIVGCQSMALVVGLLAGKDVYSAIPAHGRPSAIPYPGIVPLFQETQGMTS